MSETPGALPPHPPLPSPERLGQLRTLVRASRALARTAPLQEDLGELEQVLDALARIRPEVLRFAQAMEARMAEHDPVHAGRSPHAPRHLPGLHDALRSNVVELWRAHAWHGPEEVRAQAADVGNYACLFALAAGALPGVEEPIPQPPNKVSTARY